MGWFKGVISSGLLKLAPFAKGAGQWLFFLILEWIWKYLVLPLWTRFQAEKKARKIAEENLRKYREAIERGDEDEIGRIGSDLLNGIRR